MIPLVGGRNRISISRSHSFASGELETGWLFEMEASTPFDENNGRGVTVDSAGNVYSTGFTTNSFTGEETARVFKTDKNGVVVWQQNLGVGGNAEQGRKLILDSAGNVYVGISDANASDLTVVKFNNSGVIQWQNKLDSSGGAELNDITLDTSGNVYIVGRDAAGPALYIVVAAYNNAGALLWQRQIDNPPSNCYGHGLIVDSAGNLLVTGRDAANNYMFAAKLNAATGVITWQQYIGDGIQITRGYNVATSGTDLYVAGSAFIAGLFNGLIVKLDTSGALIWQKTYGDALSGLDMEAQSVTVDPSGNVYMTVNKTVPPFGNVFYVVKLSSAGTLLWEREFSSPAGNFEAYDVFYKTGFLYIAGTAPNGSGFDTSFLAKLPDDGSGTGSYVLNGATVNYQASSLGLATSAYSSTAAALNEGPGSIPDAPATLPQSTTTYPDYLVSL